MSSGMFRISVSTVPAFFRRSSSFSSSFAQLVIVSNNALIVSNNALIANANILFFMGPPRNEYSCRNGRAVTHSMVRPKLRRGGIATQKFLLALRMAARAYDYVPRSTLSELYVENGKRARV